MGAMVLRSNGRGGFAPLLAQRGRHGDPSRSDSTGPRALGPVDEDVGMQIAMDVEHAISPKSAAVARIPAWVCQESNEDGLVSDVATAGEPEGDRFGRLGDQEEEGRNELED